MAMPTLLYGSECWAPRVKDMRQLEASEMKFLRAAKGCTREDRIRNETIREELGVQPIVDIAAGYKEKWKAHVGRMSPERIPKLMGK